MATEERMDPIKTRKLRSLLWHTIRYIWASQIAYGRTIDVACGTGYGTVLVAGQSRVKSILGVDSSRIAIETCRQRYDHHAPRVEFSLMDAAQIPGAQTIVCFETIEHLPDPVAFFARAKRVLDPSGQLLVSVPIDERKDQNPYHLHHFTFPEFQDLIYEAGFKSEDEWWQKEEESRDVCKIVNLRLVRRG